MILKMQTKSNCRKKMPKKKEIINAKNANAKTQCKKKYKSKIICCKFKNANCRKCFWTPA
jgi:hypothetical protein